MRRSAIPLIIGIPLLFVAYAWKGIVTGWPLDQTIYGAAVCTAIVIILFLAGWMIERAQLREDRLEQSFRSLADEDE